MISPFQTLASWLRPARGPGRRTRLEVAAMEDRCVPAAYSVDRLTDDVLDGTGTTGSLRYCIAAANLTAADDTISFDAALAGGTIPAAASLDLGDAATGGTLTIDGSAAAGIVIDGAASTTAIFRTQTGASASLVGLRLRNAADGGAVVNVAGAGLGLTDMYIDANTNLTGNGGGVSNLGNLVISESLIAGNFAKSTTAADANGGGIYIGVTGTVHISNSTIAFNTANTSGGGILNDNPDAVNATLTIVNSTIVGNTADADDDGNGDGGGLYTLFGGTTASVNSIYGGNSNGLNNPFPSDIGALGAGFATEQNNLISDANTAGGTTNGANGDIVGIGIDQVLDVPGGLVDLGGGTPSFNVIATSPSINAGKNAFATDSNKAALTTDQRGGTFVRISPAAGNVDIGAIEVQNAGPPPAGTPPELIGYNKFAAAGDAGAASNVTLYNADRTVAFAVNNAFPGFTGGVRVAVGDFNDDGVPDVAAVTGPGTAAKLRVINGKDQTDLFNGPAFDGFTGGIFVTVGDVTGDDKDDIILTPDQGGGPRVIVLNGADFKAIASFFGITDSNFRGGARAGVGDMNGDGRTDIAVSAGFLGGPRVTVWDGKSVATNTPKKLFNDFFVFEEKLRNGAYVTIGDIDGDGFGDLIAGAGPGGGPRVLALSGADLVAGKADKSTVLANFFGGDPNSRSGIRVSVKDIDADNRADIVVGAAGGSSQITGYLGKNFPASTQEFTLNAITGFNGGVFVG
jgi:hypothetical protein